MSLPSPLSRLVERIVPLDVTAGEAVQRHLDSLTKPPGSLGRLEEIAWRLAVLSGGTPHVERPVLFTFAADHGVVAERVSAYPQSVTAQMVENFLRGGAAINVLARDANARVVVADFGVVNPLAPSPGLVDCRIGAGTANMVRGPAMSRPQALRAMEAGAALAEAAHRRGRRSARDGRNGHREHHRCQRHHRRHHGRAAGGRHRTGHWYRRGRVAAQSSGRRAGPRPQSAGSAGMPLTCSPRSAASRSEAWRA